jgi:uncharacterized membrane protein
VVQLLQIDLISTITHDFGAPGLARCQSKFQKLIILSQQSIMTSPQYFHRAGQVMYLVGLTELAVYRVIKKDIAMTRPPQTPAFLVELNPDLAYIGAAILILCIFLLSISKARIAAVAGIIVTVFICATFRHVADLWKDSINGFKSLWLISGALFFLWPMLGQQSRKQILFFNIIVLFVFFYLCAVAHFQFADFVKGLIPAFIPIPLFWTYFAGVCLLGGGIGLLIQKTQRLAALLLGIQIAGWFLLLHIPRALQLGGDEWIGVGESLAVAGICFMIYQHPDGNKENSGGLS